jgi:hypothetical protein
MHARRAVTCAHCQQPFDPKRRTQRFCCPPCRLSARDLRRKTKRWYRERTTKLIACAHCGHEIEVASGPTRKYCSTKCRMRAYRAREPSVTEIKKRMDQELQKIELLSRAAQLRRLAKERPKP